MQSGSMRGRGHSTQMQKRDPPIVAIRIGIKNDVVRIRIRALEQPYG